MARGSNSVEPRRGQLGRAEVVPFTTETKHGPHPQFARRSPTSAFRKARAVPSRPQDCSGLLVHEQLAAAPVAVDNRTTRLRWNWSEDTNADEKKERKIQVTFVR